MKKTLAVITAAIALTATAGFAQRPGGGGPPADITQRHDFIAGYLNLTDAQKDQVKAIFSDGASNREAGQGKMKAAQEALHEAVKSNKSDFEIDQLAAAIGALAGQSQAAQAKMQRKLYSILTDDQKKKFESLFQQRGGRP